MAEFVEVMRLDARMRRTEESMDFLYRMGDLLSTDPARFEKAVMRWAKLHPEKTMRDVLLEKFPKAKLRDDGTPIVCPHHLGFPAMSNVCLQPTQCAVCWSRPAPEE